MPDRHAILAPSSAERWFNCPRSAALSRRFPDTSGYAADEGTEAHALGEYFLKNSTNRKAYDPRPGMKYLTPEMLKHARAYAAFVRKRAREYRQQGCTTKLLIEHTMALSAWIPEGIGTADAILLAGDTLTVIDFKYGWIPVDASSLQLRIYALGAWAELHSRWEARTDIRLKTLKTIIFQPRIGRVDEWETTADDMARWSEEELRPRAQNAWNDEGNFATGRWCRFCPAAPACRARADEQLAAAAREFSSPDLLSESEIAEILLKAEEFTDWAESVRDYATSQALSGAHYPGWKLVEGRSLRRFTDEAVVAAIAESAGIDPWEPRKLLTVSAMEKRLGKKAFATLLGPLTDRPAGKPVLAHADDKRPELIPPQNDFN